MITSSKTQLLFTFLLLAFPITIFCATPQWTGAINNDWTEAGNWSTNTVPSSTDDVFIQGNFTVGIPAGTSVQVGSLSISSATVTIMSSAILNVLSQSVGASGFSATLDNADFFNYGQFLVTGGLRLMNGSSLSNHGDIIDFASVNNAQINFLIDTNSSITNHSGARMYSRDNIDPLGNRKQVFVKLDNSATFVNNGQLYNTYSSSLQDYVLKGIEVKNGSFFNNASGFINLNWIQQIAVHLHNDAGNTLPTRFENNTALRIRETDVNTDNTSIAIKIEANTTYVRQSSGQLGMNYASGFTPGFDNTTPQIDVGGTIAFLATVANPFNPGFINLGSTAVLGGTGPINNSQVVYQGGSVLPGSSPGTIIFNDPFNPTGSVDFVMEIAGNAGAGIAIEGHDNVEFLSSPNDISTANLDVVLIDGFTPTTGDDYLLFDGSYTGTFNSVNLPGDEASWDLQYNADNITLNLISPVLNVGNIGIGTTDPLTKVHVKDGDIYLESAGTGVIMKDSNGNCRKLTIDASGIISAPIINCPQ